MGAKIINLSICPHVGAPMQRIATSTKTVFLCEKCHAALEANFSDPELIRGMIRSVMSNAEVQKMRDERENMRIEKQISEAMAGAHALAGYPSWQMLPAPVGV